MFVQDLSFVTGRLGPAPERAWWGGGALGAVTKADILWQKTAELAVSPFAPTCSGPCPPTLPPGFSPQPLFWHELRPAVDADLPWAQPGGPSGLSFEGAELSPPWVPKEGALPHPSGAAESVVAAPVWLQTSFVETRETGHLPAGGDSPMAMHHSGA